MQDDNDFPSRDFLIILSLRALLCYLYAPNSISNAYCSSKMLTQFVFVPRNSQPWKCPMLKNLDNGCGSVGRAVSSDTRDSQFESSHWLKFIWYMRNVNW